MFIVSWILKLDIALVAVACFTPFALPPPPRFGRGLGVNCINITFSLQSVTFTLCNICNWPLRPSPVTIALSFPTKVCTFLWTKMLVLFSTLLLLSLPPRFRKPKFTAFPVCQQQNFALEEQNLHTFLSSGAELTESNSLNRYQF